MIQLRKIIAQLLFVFTCFASQQKIDAVPKHLNESRFKVSYIIPCYEGHAHFLPDLLRGLAQQTMIPQEVVISLSGVEKVSPGLLAQLQHTHYPFHLVIIPHHGKQLVGFNRNSACEHATGNIIICQDADDFPHLQRTQWIAACFTQYPALSLIIHGYSRFENGIKQMYDQVTYECITSPSAFVWPRDLLRHFPEYKELLMSYPAIRNLLIDPLRYPFKPPRYHNGHMAFRRELFDHVRFDTEHERGEDQVFNLQALRHCGFIGGIQEPLFWYRQQNTSYRTPIA